MASPHTRHPQRMERGVVFPPGEVPILARKYRHGTHWTHDHDFIEIALILEGTGVHFSMAGEQALQPGDVFVVHPGVWHGYKCRRTFLVYNCCIGTELLTRELAFLTDDPLLRRLVSPGAPGGGRVVSLRLGAGARAHARVLLDRLQGSLHSDPTAKKNWVAEPNRADRIGNLLLFLAHLARHLPEVDDEPAAPVHRVVKEAVELLRVDLTREWTLEELAAQVGVDPSYFVRVFKAGTGLPPIAYLNGLRVERAAALLLSSDAPVGDVGADVGWWDANYFARRFRTHVGVSPSAYRERHRTKMTPE